MKLRKKSLMNNYLKAIKLMVKAHWGQKDKGGKPYVLRE